MQFAFNSSEFANSELSDTTNLQQNVQQHPGNTPTNNVPLFNVLELWGIAIASIFFIIGFPSNLISIIVCCKSLVQKPTLTHRVEQNNHHHHHHNNKNNKTPNFHFRSNKTVVNRRDNALLNSNLNLDRSNSIRQFDHQMSLTLLTNGGNNNNNINQNFIDKFSVNNNNDNNGYENFTFDQNNKSSKKGNQNGHRPSRSSLVTNLSLNNAVISGAPKRRNSKLTMGYPTIKLARNPHRHCFELYLIEICFCDLFIVAYFFAEFVLLVLSRYKLIDSIYAEPILISKFMCHFIIAFNRTITLLHNWLVASLALTRCYAIYKPFNSTANFGSKFYFRLNLFVFISLIVVFSSLNIVGVMPLDHKLNNYTSNESTSEMPHPTCGISEAVYKRFEQIDVFINITLGIIGYSVPGLITLIINLILIYNIRNINLFRTGSKKNRSKQTLVNGRVASGNLGSSCGSASGSGVTSGNDKQHMKGRNQFFKTTSSLLTLSFCYLICYIPFSIFFLMLSLNLLSGANPKYIGIIIFVLTCLKHLNHTLNFFIYFATGKRFRNDVIAFLGFGK
jgi:hypothetical protein